MNIIQRLQKRAFNIGYIQPLKVGQLGIPIKMFDFVLSEIIIYVLKLVFIFGMFL